VGRGSTEEADPASSPDVAVKSISTTTSKTVEPSRHVSRVGAALLTQSSPHLPHLRLCMSNIQMYSSERYNGRACHRLTKVDIWFCFFDETERDISSVTSIVRFVGRCHGSCAF
jgi:hypothetical protein